MRYLLDRRVGHVQPLGRDAVQRSVVEHDDSVRVESKSTEGERQNKSESGSEGGREGGAEGAGAGEGEGKGAGEGEGEGAGEGEGEGAGELSEWARTTPGRAC